MKPRDSNILTTLRALALTLTRTPTDDRKGGKGWNVILRLYGPLEPWFNKTWRPGEIELVE